MIFAKCPTRLKNAFSRGFLLSPLFYNSKAPTIAQNRIPPLPKPSPGKGKNVRLSKPDSREFRQEKIMAGDVVAQPGNLKIDKTVFKFLYRLRVRKDFVAKLNDDNLDRLLGFMEKDKDV